MNVNQDLVKIMLSQIQEDVDEITFVPTKIYCEDKFLEYDSKEVAAHFEYLRESDFIYFEYDYLIDITQKGREYIKNPAE
jgi:hypothetical protein